MNKCFIMCKHIITVQFIIFQKIFKFKSSTLELIFLTCCPSECGPSLATQ